MEITITEYDLEAYPSDHERFTARADLDNRVYGLSWVEEGGDTREAALENLRDRVNREGERYASFEAWILTQQNPKNVETING